MPRIHNKFRAFHGLQDAVSQTVAQRRHDSRAEAVTGNFPQHRTARRGSTEPKRSKKLKRSMELRHSKAKASRCSSPDSVMTDSDMGSEDETMQDADSNPTQGNVTWDTTLNCPARPISAPCTQTISSGPQGPGTKCICGALNGGNRVPITHAKKWHYQGPAFLFEESLGAYVVDNNPNLSTPFHTFQVNGKTISQPVTISRDDYLLGARGGSLSSERTVPQCAHFPVTGLASYNVPFVKGRICNRLPSDGCHATRTQDQARFLCLIEDEVRPDGTSRRRMNIHAPPADWSDAAAISSLNRWRAQFRQRKLHVTSRERRVKWSPESLDYLINYLVRNPHVARAKLARDVSKRFRTPRTEHAVSCAIDNHKLRIYAEQLRVNLEAQASSMLAEREQDVIMSDSSDDESDQDSDGDSVMSDNSNDACGGNVQMWSV